MPREPYSLEEIIGALREDAMDAARYIGYLKALIDQEVPARKIGGSLSGRALATATAAVKQALVLYCARSWERPPEGGRGKPVISIPAAILALGDPAERLRDLQWQRPDDPELPAQELAERHSRMQARVASRHEEVTAGIKELRELATHGAMRILRTEYYAHRAINSEDRLRLAKTGPVTEATWSELLSLSEDTVILVGDLQFLWDQSPNSFPDWIRGAHAECQEFWRVLPVLSEVEDLP